MSCYTVVAWSPKCCTKRWIKGTVGSVTHITGKIPTTLSFGLFPKSIVQLFTKPLLPTDYLPTFLEREVRQRLRLHPFWDGSLRTCVSSLSHYPDLHTRRGTLSHSILLRVTPDYYSYKSRTPSHLSSNPKINDFIICKTQTWINHLVGYIVVTPYTNYLSCNWRVPKITTKTSCVRVWPARVEIHVPWMTE